MWQHVLHLGHGVNGLNTFCPTLLKGLVPVVLAPFPPCCWEGSPLNMVFPQLVVGGLLEGRSVAASRFACVGGTVVPFYPFMGGGFHY